MGASAAKIAEQDARRDHLARLRCERPLTQEERAEEELLERRLVARLWWRDQAAAEARLARQLTGEDA